MMLSKKVVSTTGFVSLLSLAVAVSCSRDHQSDPVQPSEPTVSVGNAQGDGSDLDLSGMTAGENSAVDTAVLSVSNSSLTAPEKIAAKRAVRLAALVAGKLPAGDARDQAVARMSALTASVIPETQASLVALFNGINAVSSRVSGAQASVILKGQIAAPADLSRAASFALPASRRCGDAAAVSACAASFAASPAGAVRVLSSMQAVGRRTKEGGVLVAPRMLQFLKDIGTTPEAASFAAALASSSPSDDGVKIVRIEASGAAINLPGANAAALLAAEKSNNSGSLATHLAYAALSAAIAAPVLTAPPPPGVNLYGDLLNPLPAAAADYVSAQAVVAGFTPIPKYGFIRHTSGNACQFTFKMYKPTSGWPPTIADGLTWGPWVFEVAQASVPPYNIFSSVGFLYSPLAGLNHILSQRFNSTNPGNIGNPLFWTADLNDATASNVTYRVYISGGKELVRIKQSICNLPDLVNDTLYGLN